MKKALQIDGARLWPQTQRQRIDITELPRLVRRTQSRTEALRLCVFASLR